MDQALWKLEVQSWWRYNQTVRLTTETVDPDLVFQALLGRQGTELVGKEWLNLLSMLAGRKP